MTAPGRQTYNVTAKPRKHGYELDVEGVGVTQSYSLVDAEFMARDLIMINREGRTDVPEPSFDVVITLEGGATP
jgi:hypothetical protein